MLTNRVLDVLGSNVNVIQGFDRIEYFDEWDLKLIKDYRQAGIYILWNLVTTKCYVGSSLDIGMRWKRHYAMLINGMHHSKKLQNSWKKHGCPAFQFHVLEYFEKDFSCFVGDKFEEKREELMKVLWNKETNWISKLDSYYNGYNMTPFADVSIWNAERRLEASNRMKGMWKDKEFRRKATQAATDNMHRIQGEFLEMTRERWKDPGFKEMMRETSKKTIRKSWDTGSFDTPEYRQNISDRVNKRLENEEYKTMIVGALRKGNDEYWSKQENKEKRSKKMLEKWADPIYKQMRLDNRRKKKEGGAQSSS